MKEQELIAQCLQQDRKAQRLLFERFSPTMMGVCRRYVGSREDAEDLMIEGFFKVMTNLDKYRGDGSFEGWIRRIMANECLMFLRKKKLLLTDIELNNVERAEQFSVEDKLAAQDILNLLAQLPTGYRTVFNLYVLEGYKHREIAELLQISINTSKSQLILAKKRMQELVEKQGIGIRK